MTIRKLLCIPLALILLLGTAACGGTPEKTTVQTTSADDAQTTAAPETTAKELVPELPAKDYKGKDYRILIRELTSYEFAADELTGEVINDAVFQRNKDIGDEYNVNLNIIQLGGWASESSEMLAAVRKSISAGTDEYDLVLGYQAFVVNMSMEGFFHNYYEVPYIELDMPWWSQKAVEILTLDNCLYLLTGDISTTVWRGMYALFFNKEVAEQQKVGDLYELVRSGKWLFDDFLNMSKSVSADLDGDGAYTAADSYGLVTCMANHIRQFMVSLDTPITTPDKDGYPTLTFNNPKSIGVLEKINGLYWDKSTYRDSKELQEPTASKMPDIFLQDHALFLSAFLGNAELLREMDTDFGILPYPKYDENQEEYYTATHNSVSTVLIPVTVSDVEMCGILTEALCYSGYKNIIPKYYDVVLKGKYARDVESEEMLDIIRAGLSFNFGWVHSIPMGSIGAFYSDLVSNNDTNFASAYAQREEKLKKQLADIVAKYKAAAAK